MPQKLSHPPLLIKQKLISTLSHIMIILRLTNPAPFQKKSLPIDSLIASLLVGFLPPVKTSNQMTLRHMSFEESSESLASELVSSSHELGDSSSSTVSLALRFPRAWVRTRSINSALLSLILRPFCFRYISAACW